MSLSGPTSLPRRTSRSRRKPGYQVLLVPQDGRPARTWSIPRAWVTTFALLLTVNVGLIAALFTIAGTRGAELHLRTMQLQALSERHETLVTTFGEQEEQLTVLALEAERLALRVQELESLGAEIWRLLGYDGDLPIDESFAELGRGGPDDGIDDDLAAAALATVTTLSRELPARFQELENLRETVLARNHRLAHTPSAWPSSGRVSSEFGTRRHPVSGTVQLHRGIDIAAPAGTPVTATAAGTVVFAGDRGGFGLTIVIDHGYGLQTLYAHNSQLYVKEGDVVERGDRIAAIGSTGLSTGPHVHYEVHLNGEPVNPRSFLPTRNP